MKTPLELFDTMVIRQLLHGQKLANRCTIHAFFMSCATTGEISEGIDWFLEKLKKF